MQVEDQAGGFHGGEDGVEGFVVDNAGGGIGGYARGVGFYAGDAGGGGFVDGGGCDGGVEVEGH